MVWLFSRHCGGEWSTHWHSEGRSASRPMFIRGFPIYGYLCNDCLHTYFCRFLSPVMYYSASSKMVWFFTGHYVCKCYRPLWIIPARVKWVDFSDGTVEVNHQTHWHSEVRSASRPMFIRGFPLYGYFMALYTPCFAYFIARCEFASSSNTVSTPSFANFIARCELFRVE